MLIHKIRCSDEISVCTVSGQVCNLLDFSILNFRIEGENRTDIGIYIPIFNRCHRISRRTDIGQLYIYPAIRQSTICERKCQAERKCFFPSSLRRIESQNWNQRQELMFFLAAIPWKESLNPHRLQRRTKMVGRLH